MNIKYIVIIIVLAVVVYFLFFRKNKEKTQESIAHNIPQDNNPNKRTTNKGNITWQSVGNGIKIKVSDTLNTRDDIIQPDGLQGAEIELERPVIL